MGHSRDQLGVVSVAWIVYRLSRQGRISLNSPASSNPRICTERAEALDVVLVAGRSPIESEKALLLSSSAAGAWERSYARPVLRSSSLNPTFLHASVNLLSRDL